MKKLIATALVAVCMTLTGIVYAGVSSSEEANNCTFTGNGSDYCYTSDGTHNIKVLQCAPGSTDCGYDI